MSTARVMNGVSFLIPDQGDTYIWGTDLSGFLGATSSGTLQKTGGVFALSADVDFGPTYGLKTAFLSGRTTPASAGLVRLANTETIKWRNAANSGDNTLSMATDTLTYSGAATIGGPIATGLGTDVAPSYSFTGDPNTGVFSPGADQIALATNGVARLSINSSGAVLPAADNSQAFGSTSLRWQVINSPILANGVNGTLVDSSGTTARFASGSVWTAANISTGGTARLSIDSSGNVAINQTSFGTMLTVGDTTNGRTALTAAGISHGIGQAWESNASEIWVSGRNTNIGTQSANQMRLFTNNTAQMTIDSSGNVGIGRGAAAGFRVDILGVNNNVALGANTDLRVSSNNQTASTVYGWNQLNCSGDYTLARAAAGRIILRNADVTSFGVPFVSSYDGGTSGIGSAGDIVMRRSTTSGALYFGDSSARYIFGDGAIFSFGNIFTQVRPTNDSGADLGSGANRWGTVYAVTGTINTSDATTKDEIRDLNTSETNVATAIKGLFKAYKFKDAIAKKGSDNARIHIGVMAQDVEAAFIAEGLDPRRYGLFCEDSWYEVPGQTQDPMKPEVTAETPGAVQVTRLGVRYEELLAFVISAL